MPMLRIADAVGRVLDGKYRLIRPVGAGASAYVYIADEIQLRRRVAVKILHPGLAGDQDFLRRFRSEARAVAALQHPSILHVFAYGEDEGDPYLVTELLEGGSLRALLDRGHQLSWAQAATIGLAAAQALQHANGRGLVHRDIKPANLLFDGEGRLHVADFGLARAVAESSFTVPSGAIVGTPRYAPPELVLGHPADIKADVYSLALVLIEATTGVVPFAADTYHATLMARTRGPLEVPPGAGPLVPILEQAGTLDPADRLDPLGLGRALEALLKTLPTPDPLPLAGLPNSQPGRDSNPTSLAGQRAPTRNGNSGRPGRPTSRAGEQPSVLADPSVLSVARNGSDDADREATVAWRRDDDEDGGPPTQAIPAARSSHGVYDGEVDVDPAEASRRAAATDAAADAAAAWSAEADKARLDQEFDAMMARRARARRPQGRDGRTDSEERWNAGAEAGWSGPGGPDWDEPEPPWEEEPVWDDDGAGSGRRRRALVWVAAAVVLFLLSGGGAFAWIQTHQPTPLSVVPSLTGDTEAHARQLLAGEHLSLEIAGTSYDAHVPKGTILSGQAPSAGRKLRRGESVAVTISRGPQPVKVPDVVGHTRYQAHALLAEVGLKIDKITRTTSTTVATNLIISASPDSGTLLPGQGVAIVISTGKPSVTVPKLTGSQVLSYTAAANALKADHFVPSEQLEYSTEVAKGEVIYTNPVPGATALWGSAITVLVSKGPDLVTIPDVSGMTVAEADAKLTGAGFVVSGVTGNPSRKVIGTNPAIGAQELFGSQVQIITGGHKSKSGKSGSNG